MPSLALPYGFWPRLQLLCACLVRPHHDMRPRSPLASRISVASPSYQSRTTSHLPKGVALRPVLLSTE